MFAEIIKEYWQMNNKVESAIKTKLDSMGDGANLSIWVDYYNGYVIDGLSMKNGKVIVSAFNEENHEYRDMPLCTLDYTIVSRICRYLYVYYDNN